MPQIIAISWRWEKKIKRSAIIITILTKKSPYETSTTISYPQMFLPHLSCSAIFLVLCILTSKQVLRTPFAGRNHFLSNGNGTNTHTHISCLYIKPWLVIFFVLHNFYLKNLILKVIFLLFLHRVLY